jgi:peptidoglycan/LPS O-acetylase OafA/YrhL
MSTFSYRPDIQGLRAVAVLVVVLFHLNPKWLPGGFVGVDVFLVISGYLITCILLEKKAQPNYRLVGTLSYFYFGRLKRIAPAYFAMLVIVSLTASVLFLPQDLAIYKQGLNQAAWFNSNNYFAGFGDYFAPNSYEQPLLHTWSLAIEIQFYLLAPFLILLLPVKVLQWLLAALLIGLTALAEYRLRILGIQQETYYSLYSRLPAFFTGALVALLLRTAKGGKSWFSGLGLALVLASAAAQPLLGPFPGILGLLPVAGAALFLVQPANGLLGQLMASNPIVGLGKLSYSLYLWHWPVLALLRYYTGSQELDLFYALLFIGITLLLTTLSYFAVETPLRVHRVRLKHALGYGLLAGAILGTAPAMATINQALSPAPLPQEYLRYADPSTICHGQIVGNCLKGDINSGKEVLVLGDSHAAMLNLFFDRIGKQQGFRARIITASSCVNIQGFDYAKLPEWAHVACVNQIKEAQKYTKKADIIVLAGMWSWQIEGENFEKKFTEFLGASGSNQNIIVLSQVPLLRKNPMRDRRFQSIGLKNGLALDEAYILANKKIKSLTEKHSNVIFLQLDNLSIFESAPLHQGLLLYFDESHMNENGVLSYASVAGDLIGANLGVNRVNTDKK